MRCGGVHERKAQYGERKRRVGVVGKANEQVAHGGSGGATHPVRARQLSDLRTRLLKDWPHRAGAAGFPQ